MSRDEKRAMITELSQDYPVKLLCDLLDLPRSTYYRQPHEKAGDKELLEEIEKIIMKKPYYGYRRVTHQLKRKSHEVGETRVRRLLKELEHSCQVGKVRVSTTDSRHNHRRYPNLIKELEITHINQVWVADITYIRLGRRFIYLAVILDAYSRGIRGWHLSHSLDKLLTIAALKMALANHPAPEYHHSDQGGQYATPKYTDLCLKQPRSACRRRADRWRTGLLNVLSGLSRRNISIILSTMILRMQSIRSHIGWRLST